MIGFLYSRFVLLVAFASIFLSGCDDPSKPKEALLKDKVSSQAEEMAKAADENTPTAEAGGSSVEKASFGQVANASGSMWPSSADGHNRKEAWHQKKLEKFASEAKEVTANRNQNSFASGEQADASKLSKSAAQNGTRSTSLAQTEESEVDGILDANVHRVTRRFSKQQR